METARVDPGSLGAAHCPWSLWEGEELPLPLNLMWFITKLFGLQSEETTAFSCFIHFIHTFLQL